MFWMMVGCSGSPVVPTQACEAPTEPLGCDLQPAFGDPADPLTIVGGIQGGAHLEFDLGLHGTNSVARVQMSITDADGTEFAVTEVVHHATAVTADDCSAELGGVRAIFDDVNAACALAGAVLTVVASTERSDGAIATCEVSGETMLDGFATDVLCADL